MTDGLILTMQAAGRKLQSDEGLFPNLGTSISNTLTSLSTNAHTMEENAAIELAKHVVRTLGVDSNTQGFATPHSQYGKCRQPVKVSGCLTARRLTCLAVQMGHKGRRSDEKGATWASHPLHITASASGCTLLYNVE